MKTVRIPVWEFWLYRLTIFVCLINALLDLYTRFFI